MSGLIDRKITHNNSEIYNNNKKINDLIKNNKENFIPNQVEINNLKIKNEYMNRENKRLENEKRHSKL